MCNIPASGIILFNPFSKRLSSETDIVSVFQTWPFPVFINSLIIFFILCCSLRTSSFILDYNLDSCAIPWTGCVGSKKRICIFLCVFLFFIYFYFFIYLQLAPVKAYHRDKIHCLEEDRELQVRALSHYEPPIWCLSYYYLAYKMGNSLQVLEHFNNNK